MSGTEKRESLIAGMVAKGYTRERAEQVFGTMAAALRNSFDLPIHRTEAGYPNCATCDGGGCPDCTDPANA